VVLATPISSVKYRFPFTGIRSLFSKLLIMMIFSLEKQNNANLERAVLAQEIMFPNE
jgi:hypothetical protein